MAPKQIASDRECLTGVLMTGMLCRCQIFSLICSSALNLKSSPTAFVLLWDLGPAQIANIRWSERIKNETSGAIIRAAILGGIVQGRDHSRYNNYVSSEKSNNLDGANPTAHGEGLLR